MNTTTKAWIVAASIGAVEALKDQGICRWNYSMMLLQQHAKNKIRAFTQSMMLSSSGFSSPTSLTAATATMSDEMRNARMKRREDCWEKAMHLSCWGPSTTRF